MKKIGMLSVLLAGALWSALAQAQASGQWYLGVGGGAVWTGDSPYPSTIQDTVDSGGKVYAGGIGEHWGVEFGYYYLGKFDINASDVKVGESKVQSVTAAGVYSTEFLGGFLFHGKLGVALTQQQYTCTAQCGALSPQNIDTKKSGLSGVWGLGVGVRVARNFELRTDWEHFGAVHEAISTQSYHSGFDLFSISAQLNF
jgi:OmpA-like transmembrane domain